MEDLLYEMESLRRFVGHRLTEALHVETTILEPRASISFVEALLWRDLPARERIECAPGVARFNGCAR